jgi:DNA-binding LacI/PurR family transcriptional regulator
LKSNGIRVPDDVSIVGFDDFGLSRVTTPGITTVHVPAEAMAQLATERLFDLLDGKPAGPSGQHLAVALVERASCGSH